MSNSKITFALFLLVVLILIGIGGKESDFFREEISVHPGETIVTLNPYAGIDWETFENHKAALHVHTLQSDGYHMLDKVVKTYRDAGFTIMAITDHDWNYPNARIGWGHVPKEEASPYPLDPKPENYPSNITWPWTDYGGPEPEEFGMAGIPAGELTFRHHMNSYFSDYGVWYERTGPQAPYGGVTGDDGYEIWEDDILSGARKDGGLAILDHPGLSDHRSFWVRQPVEWYVERFQNHSADFLIGMEVTNTDHYADLQEREKYDEGLWDQLLARFMPERPIWGFGTDDMHRLDNVPDSHTVFIVEELTKETVREAMERGQFYFTKSTRRIDFQKDEMSIFPAIHRIDVDEEEGAISIHASYYDEIRWISMPESLETLEDYKTSDQPWSLGRVVYEGDTLNYRETSNIRNYVRAELIREENGEIYRTFTNPFGLTTVSE